MTPLLIHLIPSNLWSGRERHALDLCRHFSAQGWDTISLTRDAKVVDAPFERHGIRVFHAPYHGVCDLATVRRLAKILSRHAPESPVVIHAHRSHDALRALLARALARRRDVRVVLTRHSVEPGRDNPLQRWIYAHVDAMICVSQRVRDAFLTTWRGRQAPITENRLHVLLNSVLDAPPAPPPMRERGPVTAMYHGPLRPGKGIETILQALTLVKARGVKLRVRIMGTGHPDYVDALRRRAIQAGVMDMIDWRRHDPRPLEVIGDVHFGVFPSGVTEAFCLPNAEFMAMGRTVVCTATGGQPEYLADGESALFVPPANAPALADALSRLATDPALRASMGAAARRAYLSRLAWPDFARALTEIYLPHRTR